MDVAGLRVTVMGLGRFQGGVSAARYLAQRGAIVAVTDLAPAEKLAESIAALADVPIARWRLGEHCEGDFSDTDLVVVNPAVKPGNRFVELARSHGVRLTSEIELFLAECSTGNVVGVTGSNGKSTTSAMIAAILSADGRKTWLGGNIGASLLDELPRIAPSDWVVLELSSFQLARLSIDVRWPRIAVVTNCSPNHLDWHPDYDDYRRAKQRLVQRVPAEGATVLNDEDGEVATWRDLSHAKVFGPVADDEIPPLRIPGGHNRQNARLAAAATRAVGVSPCAIDRGLRVFSGLPHRLERVAEIAGRTFYNDSLATTPESAIVALRAFDQPIWLLAGGSDKGANFAEFAREVATRAHGAIFYGQTGPRLAALARALAPCGTIKDASALNDALRRAWELSSPGDVILLSPACASFDQFTNFAERGTVFKQLVGELHETESLHKNGWSTESGIQHALEKAKRYFERLAQQNPSPHGGNGVAICQQFLELQHRQAVSQSDVDNLLARLVAEPSPGTGWYEVEILCRHWARQRGFEA